jgi:hypothetical protein
LAFLVLLVPVLLILLGIVYSKNKEQKDPATRFIRSARIRWDGNLGEVRNRQLMQAGIDSEPNRYSLLGRRWSELPGDIQTALIKSRIAAELTASSNRQVEGASPSEQETTPYFDAFFALAMRLSRSLSLSEWATGIPERYTPMETECIDSVGLRLKQTTLKRLAEKNGAKDVALSPYINEPLQKLVAEIGLLEAAREDRTSSYDEWGTFSPLRAVSAWSVRHSRVY